MPITNHVAHTKLSVGIQEVIAPEIFGLRGAFAKYG